MPLYRMDTKSWSSLAKVFYGIRKNKNSDFATFTKHEILSLFPEITMYMINKSRKLIKEKGIYSEPDAYSGHPIDENMEKIVMEYYLNDDFNCSR